MVLQKSKGKLWTYTYANNTKAQIDYVLINKKWKNSAMNCDSIMSSQRVKINLGKGCRPWVTLAPLPFRRETGPAD